MYNLKYLSCTTTVQYSTVHTSLHQDLWNPASEDLKRPNFFNYIIHIKASIFSSQQIGGFGSCKGDSGGPLVYFSTLDGGRKYVQVGIVHGGIGRCGSNIFPGVYVRTSDKQVLDFIKSIMGSQVWVSSIWH